MTTSYTTTYGQPQVRDGKVIIRFGLLDRNGPIPLTTDIELDIDTYALPFAMGILKALVEKQVQEEEARDG